MTLRSALWEQRVIDIEKTIRGRSPDERRAVPKTRSKLLVLALKAWFELQLTRVSGKAKIAEHIRYALNHWDGLTQFLDDGRIELDTNIVERSIRPLVLNRNYVSAGLCAGAGSSLNPLSTPAISEAAL
jgi:transposase